VAPPTGTPLTLAAVAWPDVTVPGAVCGAPGALHLHDGSAMVASPPALHAGTAEVVARLGTVVDGTLAGAPVAAVRVSCATTSGTADGQLDDSWVIYGVVAGTLRVLADLQPRQPAGAPAPHAPTFAAGTGALRWSGDQLVVQELWWAPGDATCCPTLRASTVWTDRAGVFDAVTTDLATASLGSWTGVDPVTMSFSGDAGNIVTDIRWSSWGAVGAVGTGRWGYESCVPSCAQGTVTDYPATITLSAAVGGRFTRLSESQAGPHGHSYVFALPAPTLSAQ